MRNLSFFLLFFLATCYAQGQTKNIYVAVNGADGNAGTVQKPMASLQKALLAAVKFKRQTVNIQLRGGIYYLDTTIVLNAADVSANAVHVTAFKGEKVTLSAGRALKLSWQPYKAGVFKAAVPKGISFERLYINGQARQLARYPNYNDTSRVYHGTSADAVSAERISRWKNPAGGYIHALHAGEWGSFDYLITGVNPDGTLMTVGGWQNNRPAPMNKKYRFVENIFEELDAPDEWYLDKAKSTLYYYPTKGMDLTTAKVEVSHLKNTIELHGSSDSPVKNITFSQINFRHNERTFMDTKEPLLRSDWCIYRGGAILFDGTENCNIKDCSFEGLGGNAIMVSNYNKNDTISGCLVAHIGASAVCFVGDPKAVRSPLFNYEDKVDYETMDKTPGPLTDNYPQSCVVTDNLFHDLGEIEKQATGVQITMSSTITVSHNSIYSMPRAGLNINDGCWGGHILAYNDVFNTVLESGDHGSFNSWGRDRYWSADRKYMDSLVQAHPEIILLDAQKPNLIHDNRFRCDHGWDIDLDDGSTNYHIYNNLCLKGGIKLREGFYRVVENNILINNTFHPHVWFKNSGDVFEHNIVDVKYRPVYIKYWGLRIDSNFFSSTTALNDVRKNGTDKNSVAGKLMFTSAQTGNYTVDNESGAFAVGFKNIDMHQFGVQKPSLKKIALTPVFPTLNKKEDVHVKARLQSFLGGSIKSVEGLGERSAFGLPDVAGAIIISMGENSLLSKSGLREKDVIVSADKKAVVTVDDLLTICKSVKQKSEISVTFYRNQQIYTLTLQLR